MAKRPKKPRATKRKTPARKANGQFSKGGRK
ncbi:hypothetical protein Jorvik_04 [Rhodobacter phage Jorvik]|nr:hypothetical protein Jorvik_04 [Rhodobacter phage Jorvik]